MKHIVKLIIAIAMMMGGLAFVAPAANATETDSDFKFTVIAKDLSVGAADFSIENRKRLLVEGATQVSWENPNHNVKVTKKQVRKAPHLKVKATGANSSKVIWKKSGRAKIVVLKRGSCVRNTGRENRLLVGFVWCLKYDAVLVFDAKSRQYRHSHNIIGGRLIKTCLNYIGGNVPMRDKVVQVRYEQDVRESAEAVAKALVEGTVTFKVTCPTGAWFNTIVHTSAFGYGRAAILFSERTRVSVMNAHRAKIVEDMKADGNASALAAAETSIEVSGNCGSTPPPVTPKAVVEIDQLNDIDETDPNCEAETPAECESWTVFQGHVTVPNGVSGTLRVSSDFGSVKFTSNNQKTLSLGTGQYDPEIKFVAPTEVPAGGFAHITLTFVPDKGETVTATTRIRINDTPQPPL